MNAQNEGVRRPQAGTERTARRARCARVRRLNAFEARGADRAARSMTVDAAIRGRCRGARGRIELGRSIRSCDLAGTSAPYMVASAKARPAKGSLARNGSATVHQRRGLCRNLENVCARSCLPWPRRRLLRRSYLGSLLRLCRAQHPGQRHTTTTAPDPSVPRERRHPCWELIKV